MEVLGYLGGGLALVAGFVLGAESWTQLGHWGRVAVLAGVTTVLLAAGWRLREDRGRVLPRLASVLWLAAVAAFAGLLAVLLGGRSDDALDDPSLWVAGGALVLAGGLYLLERRVLQQVALFAAVVATMAAAGDELGWPWEQVEGYGFLVLGLAWLELGRRGLVGPRRTSEALGSLVLLSGPEVLDAGGPGRGLGAVARAGLAVGLIVAGSALRRNVPLGIGAVGMVVFLGQLAGQHWRDLGAPWPSCWSGWAWSWPRWCWRACGPPGTGGRADRAGRARGAASWAAPRAAGQATGMSGLSRGRRSGR